MATHEFLMEASAFAYREGYKEGAKNLSEVEDKHWNECRQISEYQAENRAMKECLRELRPILRKAFFAHYEHQNKADELYDRIVKIVGRE